MPGTGSRPSTSCFVSSNRRSAEYEPPSAPPACADSVVTTEIDSERGGDSCVDQVHVRCPSGFGRLACGPAAGARTGDLQRGADLIRRSSAHGSTAFSVTGSTGAAVDAELSDGGLSGAELSGADVTAPALAALAPSLSSLHETSVIALVMTHTAPTIDSRLPPCRITAATLLRPSLGTDVTDVRPGRTSEGRVPCPRGRVVRDQGRGTLAAADLLVDRSDEVLAANSLDIDRAEAAGATRPLSTACA